jgi:hypothetical protein
MTRLPVKPPIPTEQAPLFIRQIREQFTVVAAAKSGADIIYTWDIDDFQRVSPPEASGKIRVP